MSHKGAVIGARLLHLTRRLCPVMPGPARAGEPIAAAAMTGGSPPAPLGVPAIAHPGDGGTGVPYSAAGAPVTARPEATVEFPESRVCYVYGIVPARTPLPDGLRGTGGGPVSLVPYGALAAVISEIPPCGARGTQEDLRAHESVVAALAGLTTMLPLRFSAVVTTATGVVEDILAPYYDWFTDVLADLAGRSEFSVSGAYVQDTVLREVLAEEPEVMRLREDLRGLPEDAGYYERVRLGELIVQALDAKREVDTGDLLRSLSPHAVAVEARPPVNEDTAADVAFLVADDQRDAFRTAADELAYRWAGRIKLRVRGPLAPYDFVPSPLGGFCG
jgi:hypothetical protein